MKRDFFSQSLLIRLHFSWIPWTLNSFFNLFYRHRHKPSHWNRAADAMTLLIVMGLPIKQVHQQKSFSGALWGMMPMYLQACVFLIITATFPSQVSKRDILCLGQCCWTFSVFFNNWGQDYECYHCLCCGGTQDHTSPSQGGWQECANWQSYTCLSSLPRKWLISALHVISLGICGYI